MRWFALVFTATVAFTPLVVGVVQEDEPIQLLGYCARIPLVLVFGGLLYLAGTVIVRAKFRSFISKTFGGGKLTTR
jgi:hypothetical protein